MIARSTVRAFATAICMAAATATGAAPQAYNINSGQSEIAFEYDLSGSPARGKFKRYDGNFVLDLSNPPQSDVRVNIAANSLSVPLPFVKTALNEPDMLWFSKHTQASFRTTDVRAKDGKATIKGLLTLKGISRPITLSANLSRPAGRAKNDFSDLTVLLTGSFKRADFGITGYPKLVGPNIKLSIRAVLREK